MVYIMDPVYGSNGKFMEIVIPANEAINADVLLEKYGIHADVEIVEGGTISGGKTISDSDSGTISDSGTKFTYPYAFFHWFFSFFSPSNIFNSGVKDTKEEPVDKDTIVEEPVDKDTIEEKPVVEEKPVDKDTTEEPEEEPVDKDTTEEPEEEPVDKEPEEEKPVDKEPVDKEPEEEPVEEPVDKEPVEEPVENSSSSSNKSMKITINSIDGVRPW